MGEDGHAGVVIGVCRGAGRDGHGRGLGAEFEIAAPEVVQRGFILEEDELGVFLPPACRPMVAWDIDA